MPPVSEILAVICIVWYVVLSLVCAVGCIQLFLHYSHVPEKSVSASLPQDEVPHVTVIRPCKGSEPYLYECLASSLQQDYPPHKLTVYLCVASRNDPAFEILERLKDAYSQHDIHVLVEEEDPCLQNNRLESRRLGPNPKIRNMSRAYREAKSDLIWILDCNIWVSKGVCGRMVDRIVGYSLRGQQRPFKFVHHLPVAVDVPVGEGFRNWDRRPDNGVGGRLDEAFLSSAHAKMYTAINAVAVAPCICGKSSMFRRSHLNALTNKDHSTDTRFGSGIDYFSDNICEDHLIGDLLWREKPPQTMPAEARSWRNHGLVYGDLALQPISGMSIAGYIARRVRWLRVRKFTVPLATLVEPGTESLLASLLGAFGLTTAPATKPWFGSSWPAMFVLWLISVMVWIVVDWIVYILLQSGKTIDEHGPGQTIPPFAQPLKEPRRPFLTWLKSWIGREALALPVWTWAIWGGATVVWRDKKLWVGFDMKVHEFDGDSKHEQMEALLSTSHDGLSRAVETVNANGHAAKTRQD